MVLGCRTISFLLFDLGYRQGKGWMQVSPGCKLASVHLYLQITKLRRPVTSLGLLCWGDAQDHFFYLLWVSDRGRGGCMYAPAVSWPSVHLILQITKLWKPVTGLSLLCSGAAQDHFSYFYGFQTEEGVAACIPRM